MKKLMTFVLGATMMLAPAFLAPATASAARIFIGGGFYGPGPYYWGPAWGPGYAFVGPAMGEVKIDTKMKDDEVFINGAFAGMTKDSKTFHLRSGTYNIEVRHAGQTEVNEKVFVAAGKTLHLHPEV